MRKHIIRNAAALSAFAGAIFALPSAEADPFIPEGRSADAPYGYAQMCRRDPQGCRFGNQLVTRTAVGLTADCSPRLDSTNAQGGMVATYARLDRTTPLWSLLGTTCGKQSAREASPAVRNRTALSAETMGKMLRTVNRDVNRVVVQISDLANNGREEIWQRPQGRHRLAGDCEDIAIEKRVRLVEAGFDPSRLFFATVYSHRYGLHTILVARLPDGDWVLDSLTSRFLRWDRTSYSWLRQEVAGQPGKWETIGPGRDQIAAARPADESASSAS